MRKTVVWRRGLRRVISSETSATPFGVTDKNHKQARPFAGAGLFLAESFPYLPSETIHRAEYPPPMMFTGVGSKNPFWRYHI
jgi:hypothetical protein